jgi:hypothetical protein
MKLSSLLKLVTNLHQKFLYNLVANIPVIEYELDFFFVKNSCILMERHHDIQHNDIQHNDIQHNDTQHNGPVCDTQHNSIMLSVVFNILLC